MDDLRTKQKKTRKPSKFWFWIKKHKWWIISFIIIAVLIIFPSDAGRLIGTWIHNFVGNLIHFINL